MDSIATRPFFASFFFLFAMKADEVAPVFDTRALHKVSNPDVSLAFKAVPKWGDVAVKFHEKPIYQVHPPFPPFFCSSLVLCSDLVIQFRVVHFFCFFLFVFFCCVCVCVCVCVFIFFICWGWGGGGG